MEDPLRPYAAKLLLFGEHTVLKGSGSLAIPLKKHTMRWVNINDGHPDWLTDYISYLHQKSFEFLNLKKLDKWLETYTIKANIPIGYGLGSSGALTAAIYNICKLDHRKNTLDTLQSYLGAMESFFHGKSSGFDPLVSLCGTPIFKSKNKNIRMDFSELTIDSNFYLLNSGNARHGKTMIKMFLENYNNCIHGMIQLEEANDTAIKIILGKSSEKLHYLSRTISALQLEYMSYMIVPDLIEYWKEGLESQDYSIKICGAGGGGYYLVNSKKEIEKIGSYSLEKVEFI